MIEEVVKREGDGFHWIDVVDPSHPEVEAVAEKYGLHPTSVQDCLDPEHLPKHERIGPIVFIILRAYDENSGPNVDSVQEMTRKVAIFVGDHFIVTIHRKDQPFLQAIRARWKLNPPSAHHSLRTQILNDLLRGVLLSYEKPIDASLARLETFEMRIFGTEPTPFVMQEGYYLKRRASVFKRILRMSMDIVSKLNQFQESNAPLFQDLREESESLYFYADEILEGIQSLLNLHISLASQKTNEASHRTNEVMRVLTVFSVFFLPLNFIASIYGMNFEHIPELKWTWGYPLTLSIMALVSIGIYTWFRRKGWLR